VGGKETLQWLHKIAANGNTVAQEFLARAYEEGTMGLCMDKAQARYGHQQTAKRKTIFNK
jgi:TPR repeat protein